MLQTQSSRFKMLAAPHCTRIKTLPRTPLERRPHLRFRPLPSDTALTSAAQPPLLLQTQLGFMPAALAVYLLILIFPSLVLLLHLLLRLLLLIPRPSAHSSPPRRLLLLCSASCCYLAAPLAAPSWILLPNRPYLAALRTQTETFYGLDTM